MKKEDRVRLSGPVKRGGSLRDKWIKGQVMRKTGHEHMYVYLNECVCEN